MIANGIVMKFIMEMEHTVQTTLTALSVHVIVMQMQLVHTQMGCLFACVLWNILIGVY